jgi:hypothetical protein
MHFFLYSSAGFAILIFMFLITIQSRKYISKRGILSSKMLVYLLYDIAIVFFVMIIGTFIIPYIIWTSGEKDYGIAEVIRETRVIHPFSTSEPYKYIQEVHTNDSTRYVVNFSRTTPQTSSFDKNRSQIITAKRHQTNKYERIHLVEIYKLSKNNFIHKSVNDVFANPYTQRNKTKFVQEVFRFTVPDNSIMLQQ